MQWALHVSGPFTSLVLCAVWLCGAPGTALIMVSQSGTAAQTHSGHSLSSMRACHTHLALLMALGSGQTLVCGTQSLMTHQQMPIGSTLWSSDGGRLSTGMHGDWTNFNDSFIFIWTHAGVSHVWADAEVELAWNAAMNSLCFYMVCCRSVIDHLLGLAFLVGRKYGSCGMQLWLVIAHYMVAVSYVQLAKAPLKPNGVAQRARGVLLQWPSQCLHWLTHSDVRLSGTLKGLLDGILRQQFLP